MRSFDDEDSYVVHLKNLDTFSAIFERPGLSVPRNCQIKAPITSPIMKGRFV